MDADKLNEAAELHSTAAYNKYPEGVTKDTFEYECNKAFKRGVEWLMQQPLADRLTDEEKERIKAKHSELKSLNSISNEMFADDTAILEWLFGKELFNKK